MRGTYEKKVACPGLSPASVPGVPGTERSPVYPWSRDALVPLVSLTSPDPTGVWAPRLQGYFLKTTLPYSIYIARSPLKSEKNAMDTLAKRTQIIRRAS